MHKFPSGLSILGPVVSQVEDNLGALPIIAKLTPEVVSKIDAVIGKEYE